MAEIDTLFRYMRDQGCSDLHLSAGMEPRVRRKGALVPVEDWSVQSDEQILAMLKEIANDAQWDEYVEGGDLDFAYGLPGVARFRANYLRQQRGAAAVFRIIPEELIPIEKLNLPAAINELVHLQQGLVLVTGPTGSGKSTTLAAIIDAINNRYSTHIVTIEDPEEFVHRDKNCAFSQREVGRDTDGFGGALRAAIRQDADVVLVGEMRDLETIGLAITAAEMGALVFGTLHTNNAAKTIDRSIDAFPADQQSQIRVSLSESLAAVVSQLLLPTADGKGRCAVNEILLKTQGLPNVIREGNTPMLHSIIQSGKSLGMQGMDDALFSALQDGRILPRDAYMKASNKARFEPMLPPDS